MIKKNKWERDSLKYQEARNQERHLSTITYVALGFYMTIAGYFVSLDRDKVLIPLNYLGICIGLIFLNLLLMISKIARSASDNAKIMSDFDKMYDSPLSFDKYRSSIEGVGNFFQFTVLNALTVFFILYPLNMQFPSDGYLLSFLIVFLPLLFITYWVLGHGKFIFKLDCEPCIQYGAYSIIFLASFVYIVLYWPK